MAHRGGPSTHAQEPKPKPEPAAEPQEEVTKGMTLRLNLAA